MVPPTALDVASPSDIQIVTYSDKLTVNDVQARRSRAPKLGGGIAAHASSDMFKSPGSYFTESLFSTDGNFLGDEICFAALLASHSLFSLALATGNLKRKGGIPSSLKGAITYLKNPGIISLGGGLPSSKYFPFEHIDIRVPQPPHFSEEETKESGVVRRIGKYDIADGKGIYDIHVALNYGQATGSAQLLRFITEHTEIVHHPPYRDWQCCMTVGSTSALDIAYRMFTNRGEYMLTEEYAFSTAAETARPIGVQCIGVKMDAEGLLPSHLDSLLSDWDSAAHNNAPKPWLLYTVPSGQNPTGATQSLERRKEIYRVAQKHDLYILEDEPYFFLQMQPYTGPNVPDTPPPSSHEAFLKALVPSLLSMDIDGRVMRLDSFSKVIAPGMRLGWVTASEQIVERFVRHSEVSTQNPSGTSQLILFKLLEETWGHSGYFDWLINLRLEYTKRRDNICYACEKYLPREVASWNPPMAGMFHWIKIDWQKHPSKASKSLLDIENEIFHAAIDRGTLTSKGSWFRAETSNPGNEVFFRTTFAAADDDQVAEAISRFGNALRAVFHLEKGSNGVVDKGDS